MRKHTGFDMDWQFSLNDLDAASEVLFDSDCWQRINIPHDFSVGQPFEKNAKTGTRGGFTKSGVGYYRKHFFMDKETVDKKVSLLFDGVFMNAKIWINGVEVYERPYGYISFAIDISSYIHYGENLVAVRVDCENQNQSRWYNGCGIYRHVWLTVTDKIYIKQWGTFIHTEQVDENGASLNYTVEIHNELPQAVTVNIDSTIVDDKGVVCKKAKMNQLVQTGENSFSQKILVENPELWCPESPHLYTIETIITDQENNEIDCYKTVFGIRTTAFVPNVGFLLNGNHYKFKGVCLHHDGGVVGAAVPTTIWRKRLGMLKDMGCNSIRTAHNPFAPEFYDVCDELGLFVMDEIFDGWETEKAPYDYGLYFEKWHEIDAVDFIKRDRNHPSVVIWSIGNEVRNMSTKTTEQLLNIFHTLDQTRAVTCGVQGVGQISDDNRAMLDVAGYNDGGGACFVYERDHEKRPDQLMIATEAPHTSQTRGYYRTQTWWRDKNQPRIEIENLTEKEIFMDGHIDYSSSYDNHGVRTCARDSYNIVEKLPYLCGEFRWTGIDYIGETFRWPCIKSESGVIDTANFKKDHYYLYQSMWCDKETTPMIHILPHWTHPDLPQNTIVPVWVYTNCDEIQLMLNGVIVGKKSKGDNKHLQFDLCYQSGELKAIGYIQGKEMCSMCVKTATNPHHLQLSADTGEVMFNQQDTIQIDCMVVDEHGIMVPSANNTIHFDVDGEASIVGTDNGNSIDLTPLNSPVRNAFNGLCACTIRLSDTKGAIHLQAVAVLGNKIFADHTWVCMSQQNITLFASPKIEVCEIFYCLHDNKKPKILYTQPFEIKESTTIYVEVYKNDSKTLQFSERFVKGKKPPVVDLTHGNKLIDSAIPLGPFSDKICGVWNDGNFNLIFRENGELERYITSERTQLLGYWWYDFPVDFFEAQDYAGTGELWLNSGEKLAINLITQEGKELKVDNLTGAFGTAYGFEKTLTFTKL